MKNQIGREIPETIPGYGKVNVSAGAFATIPDGKRQAPPIKRMRCPGRPSWWKAWKKSLNACPLKTA